MSVVGYKVSGVVAAGSKLTASAGAAMLDQGGNAIDAAVAAACMSFAAESCLSTLGGAGYALVRQAGHTNPYVLDFSGGTPSLPKGRATQDGGRADIDFTRVLARYESSTEPIFLGRASSAIPGNAAGLATLHRDGGRLPLWVVMEPAIETCRRGVVLTEAQARNNCLYLEIIEHTPELTALYMADGKMKQAGERLHMAELADTLDQIAREGEHAFYRGDIAKLIVRDQAEHGGLITAADLEGYRAIRREPLTARDGDRVVVTNGPPSSGGFLLLFARALYRSCDPGGLIPGSPEAIDLLADVMRWTDVARAELGAELANDQGAVRRFGSAERVMGWAARLKDWRKRPVVERPVAFGMGGPPGTTHISTLDGEGNAVSLTTSPGFMAGYLTPGTGVVMNNLLGEPDLNPQGFHSYVPGARIASMMAPTLAMERDRPVLAIGSGGGSRLRSAILQVLLNHYGFKMPLASAVNAPRVAWEVVGRTATLHLEPGFKATTVDALSEIGYRVNVFDAPSMFFGGTHCTAWADGQFGGAGDPRREGHVQIVGG